MGNTKYWIEAFRLRTLPLALSSIGLGSFLAAFEGNMRWDVFLLIRKKSGQNAFYVI